MMKVRLLVAALAFVCSVPMMQAQYFGQNKPRYHKLDFEVLETSTFDIHHYLKNKAVAEKFASDAENWYLLHRAILNDSLPEGNPMLLYNDHADFQMTNAISSQIGVGTGGVTESLKNRVVMPLTFTNEQTHHVLGHEMVHAFQYKILQNPEMGGVEAMRNVPLWMVEGLAEYMSIGRIDAHTSMWMRDAVLNSDVPSIKDLNSYKYFPYRYGHAFWAFLTGIYGDEVIRPFFEQTAKSGLDKAVVSMFGMSREEMSKKFQQSLKDHYTPLMSEESEARNTIGREILSGKNSGDLNVSPSLSPDGRHLTFLSEKNLFSTDIYLATASGKVLKRMTTIVRDGHLDDLSFIESSATWSPNSKQLAFIAFKDGVNVIVIKDVESAKTTEVIEIPGVPAITNPTWSPNGRYIAFTGMVEGQSDLYQYNLRNGKVTQLTNDIYAQIQPNYSADGKDLTFSTDKISMVEGRTHGKYKMNIAVMNLETETVGDIRIFDGADNMNPSFDNEGNIVFLSDRDGFRNMYKYEMASGDIFQMTKLNTGISGITKYSPAISVSRKKDRIVYTHYYRGDYSIHQTSAEKLLKIPVDRNDVDFTAATLPSSGEPQLIVQSNLEKIDQLPDTTATEERPYRPRFTLDHFGGGAGVGVGTGNIGSQAALAGGVQMFFSDITGNHQLLTSVAINGSLRDIGGQITYLNRKNRIAYGVSVSHLPQRFFTGSLYSRDTIGVNGSPTIVDRIDNYVLTIFEENASLIAELPLSKTTRLEANAGMTYRFYRMDAFPEYYYPGGGFIGEGDRERIPLEGDEFNLGYYTVRKGAFYNFTGAFVGDNAQFGVTAPMNGYRYRFEVTKFVGTYDFLSTNADVRGYKWLGPVALAGRFQFGARHGKDANSFNPIFVGWQGFVRGYTYNQIEKLVANDPAIIDDINFRSDVTVMYRRLSGSKYFNAGLEVRLPFTGPEKLALFKSNVLLTDLNFFFDAGAAFEEWSHFSDGERIIVNRPGGISEEYHKPKVAMSTGLSMRVNLFGAMVVEPYFAYPLQKNSRMVFGFNFLPGW